MCAFTFPVENNWRSLEIAQISPIPSKPSQETKKLLEEININK